MPKKLRTRSAQRARRREKLLEATEQRLNESNKKHGKEIVVAIPDHGSSDVPAGDELEQLLRQAVEQGQDDEDTLQAERDMRRQEELEEHKWNRVTCMMTNGDRTMIALVCCTVPVVADNDEPPSKDGRGTRLSNLGWKVGGEDLVDFCYLLEAQCTMEGRGTAKDKDWYRCVDCLEWWNDGMMERWKVGMMEWWISLSFYFNLVCCSSVLRLLYLCSVQLSC